MRLKNSIDYKRFPEPSRGDWTRFTILVLSAIFLAKTPSECTQRGFFLFLRSKKMHQTVTRPYLGRFCGDVFGEQQVSKTVII